MQVEDLATRTMEYAADLLDANKGTITTDTRLKVLYQVTKVLEVCKTRESIVQQFHITSSEQPNPGGVS
ncbi:MAG: hypothetical protein ED559_07825 [Phycisphaera sp.]|nr:MAG: hypothetical protein ED559_07825 [Phycisphaera sp.]